ncbi:MAG: hypothetical protein COB04_17235 [Gammaproteobacteria bacterium]|nr:MAG: hypothetical protein COB04_17235 [Gammaproteobacteria bacterium]
MAHLPIFKPSLQVGWPDMNDNRRWMVELFALLIKLGWQVTCDWNQCWECRIGIVLVTETALQS